MSVIIVIIDEYIGSATIRSRTPFFCVASVFLFVHSILDAKYLCGTVDQWTLPSGIYRLYVVPQFLPYISLYNLVLSSCTMRLKHR